MPQNLTIELVPRTCFFKNLRSELTKKQWDLLRNKVYLKAGGRCEICGGKGTKHAVEAHEIWDYDETGSVQKLVGLVALCPSCHEVKHIGLAEMRGRLKPAIKHLAKVNNWTEPYAFTYVLESFQLWEERSKRKWTLDITWVHQME